MFVDKEQVKTPDFILLMFLLNTTKAVRWGLQLKYVRLEFSKIISRKQFETSLENVDETGLIYFFDPEKPGSTLSIHEAHDNACVGLTFLGVSFLVNYAEEYLNRVYEDYGELPENLTASLLPYLELRSVPAADRYVSTADNHREFRTLSESLETIRLEILKDQNRNQLPIRHKRAVIAELDGMLAQVKGGFVRLSDLTSKIRPMVKSLAETCKDITVIAGAAAAAYMAISQILAKLF